MLDGVECHGLKEQTDQMLNEQTDQVLKEQGDQVLQQLGDKVLKQQGVAGYDVHQTDQGTGDDVPSGRNFLLEDVPSGSKRPSNLTTNLPLTLPTNHSTNMPFCTSSQSLSVAKVGHNTEAMTAVMTSYGALMGQMAKGMLEGVGPQLMSMLQNFQVVFKENNVGTMFIICFIKESTVTRSESMNYGEIVTKGENNKYSSKLTSFFFIKNHVIFR